MKNFTTVIKRPFSYIYRRESKFTTACCCSGQCILVTIKNSAQKTVDNGCLSIN